MVNSYAREKRELYLSVCVYGHWAVGTLTRCICDSKIAPNNSKMNKKKKKK